MMADDVHGGQSANTKDDWIMTDTSIDQFNRLYDSHRRNTPDLIVATSDYATMGIDFNVNKNTATKSIYGRYSMMY